ncbi:hypothetical protein [Nostoc sp.]|uniref:hypothetical protein n=1 Tax=Nostoc sp. TaxID=1180 RepID=UPI002FFB9C99
MPVIATHALSIWVTDAQTYGYATSFGLTKSCEQGMHSEVEVVPPALIIFLVELSYLMFA